MHEPASLTGLLDVIGASPPVEPGMIAVDVRPADLLAAVRRVGSFQASRDRHCKLVASFTLDESAKCTIYGQHRDAWIEVAVPARVTHPWRDPITVRLKELLRARFESSSVRLEFPSAGTNQDILVNDGQRRRHIRGAIVDWQGSKSSPKCGRRELAAFTIAQIHAALGRIVLRSRKRSVMGKTAVRLRTLRSSSDVAGAAPSTYIEAVAIDKPSARWACLPDANARAGDELLLTLELLHQVLTFSRPEPAAEPPPSPINDSLVFSTGPDGNRHLLHVQGSGIRLELPNLIGNSPLRESLLRAITCGNGETPSEQVTPHSVCSANVSCRPLSQPRLGTGESQLLQERSNPTEAPVVITRITPAAWLAGVNRVSAGSKLIGLGGKSDLRLGLEVSGASAHITCDSSHGQFGYELAHTPLVGLPQPRRWTVFSGNDFMDVLELCVAAAGDGQVELAISSRALSLRAASAIYVIPAE